MRVPDSCPRCGAALAATAPGGLCPACLLAAAIDEGEEATVVGESQDTTGEPAVRRDSGHEASRTAGRAHALEPGCKLNHYEIAGPLGAGGMGEVYRAVDERLRRDVAIKLLAPDLAADTQLRRRFKVEAQAVAALNHPNIVTVHAVEQAIAQAPPSSGLGQPAPQQTPVDFLVLELVEGESLRQQLARGPLPVAKAIDLCVQIAQGLEAAHDKGIVHRDLKPDNVLITPQGRAKLLDFGIAKSVELDSEIAEGTGPTRLTVEGTLIGTPPYMSPEQVRGEVIDRRTDIWALGCVLYETLTATPAFAGATLVDTLAAILDREPDWSRLPAATPQEVRSLLHRYLRKDADRRLRDVADARIELQDAQQVPSAGSEPLAYSDAASADAHAPPFSIPRMLMVALGVVGLLLVGFFAGRTLRSSPGVNAAGGGSSMRLDVRLTEGGLYDSRGSSIALSPDGRRLAYVVDSAADDGGLYIRSLDQSEGVRVVAGAAFNPFFSPDGQSVGFFDNTELKRVPVSGGTPLTIGPVHVTHKVGASWSIDDTIVYAPLGFSGLVTVSATGGASEELTSLDPEAREVTHRRAHVLPAGNAVLFTSHDRRLGFDSANIEVLDRRTQQRKVLVRGGFDGRYVPSGHLVYANGTTLFAAPFDADRLELTGPVVPIAQGVRTNPSEGSAHYSFSSFGALAYLTGDSRPQPYRLVTVDRQGLATPLWEEPGLYGGPLWSPEAGRVALSVESEGNVDVWSYDIERTLPTRLTFYDGMDSLPVWSPDGRYLAFASDRDGPLDIYRTLADGSGEIERMTENERPNWPVAWRDRDSLIYSELNQESEIDTWELSLGGDAGSPVQLHAGYTDEAVLSPDRRWFAYRATDSESSTIWVRSFPEGSGNWQISTTDGGQPRWSGDGSELFYRTGAGLMVWCRSTPMPRRSRGAAPRRSSRATSSVARAGCDSAPTACRTMTSPPTDRAS